MKENNILTIDNLKITFNDNGEKVYAVRDLRLGLREKEILCLVGESGSGKSITGSSIIRLTDYYNCEVEGRIIFKNRDILKLNKEDIRNIRGNEISMIFQEPSAYLHPFFTVGYQIDEALCAHYKIKKQDRMRIIEKIFEYLRLSSDKIKSYPHQLSGGEKQRAMIAMAIICRPFILIADEPTTALDVSVQKSILDLLKKMNREYNLIFSEISDLIEKNDCENLSIIFITHDFSVVEKIADRVAVMYAGRIVEQADRETILKNPKHPYTKALIECMPSLVENKRIKPIRGVVYDLSNNKEECEFCDRCDYVMDICRRKNPDEKEIEKGHKIKCHLFQQIGDGP